MQDDGVGMPPQSAPGKAGLGTSIVEALSKQLSAKIVATDAHPGTNVSVVHGAGPGETTAAPTPV